MSLREFRFPHQGDSNRELRGGVVSARKLDDKTIDSDSRDFESVRVAVFPGWGVRMESLEPLARRLAMELDKDVLVVEENYGLPRPRDNLNEKGEYHIGIARSVLSLFKDRPDESLIVAYSKACVPVTQAMEGQAHYLAYLQGPFLDPPLTANQLTARFVAEGLTDSLSVENWSGLVEYSMGLVRDIILKPRSLFNALEDVGLIAQGVDRELIPDKSLAFQARDDSLFPYDEARRVWASIGREMDLVPLQKGNSRRGHLYPIVEGEFAGHFLIDHMRRRFGDEAI